MTKRSTQEINFTSDQDRKSKFAANKKGMPTIRCICGSKILIVPDLKAMRIAIKTHVADHKKANDDFATFDSLEQNLTEQVLIVAKKINLPNVN